MQLSFENRCDSQLLYRKSQVRITILATVGQRGHSACPALPWKTVNTALKTEFFGHQKVNSLRILSLRCPWHSYWILFCLNYRPACFSCRPVPWQLQIERWWWGGGGGGVGVGGLNFINNLHPALAYKDWLLINTDMFFSFRREGRERKTDRLKDIKGFFHQRNE